MLSVSLGSSWHVVLGVAGLFLVRLGLGSRAACEQYQNPIDQHQALPDRTSGDAQDQETEQDQELPEEMTRTARTTPSAACGTMHHL